jgi:hypothetical protein
MAAGCHAPGGLGTTFAFAGTAYKEINGTTINPGVVIRLFPQTPEDAAPVATVVADQAGNFYYEGNLTAFPYITDVTACGADAAAVPVPGIRRMAGIIVQASMNCNNGTACHQTPGANAIYLAD